jgi:hypothetical protein
MRALGSLLFFLMACTMEATPSAPSRPPDARQQPARVAMPTPPAAPSASALADPPKKEADVRFLALGDMIVTHSVGRAVDKSGDPTSPFRTFAAMLEGVDFSYANLEAPLEANTPLEGLAKLRFRAFNLANNHIMDAGFDRLLLTVNRLRAMNMATSGVGKDMAEAWTPAIVTVRGVRIAFVGASYTSKNSSRLVRLPYVARVDQNWELRKAILQARESADFVVAAMHAGTEYIRFPVAEQIQFAHSAIEHGADLVIGTHPHVVQKVERYRGNYIFYSLGNFVFDQVRPPQVGQSAAVRVSLSVADKGLSALEVIPMVNHDTLSPRLADGKAAKAILQRMGLQSATLLTATQGLPQEATPPK